MALLNALRSISPFGPIFTNELRITSRRRRTYALRVIYLAILLLILLMIWSEGQHRRDYGGAVYRAQEQARLGQYFFGAFSLFSVVAMGLISPLLTCTAINSERLRKTLPVLLMTPINRWQIVGGKLFSRVWIALILLGLTLPVLAVVRLFGSVEIDAMFASVALAATMAITGAALGLFFSAIMDRAYAVILLMTAFAQREIVGIAYDSGGVTVSTVTVPLVTALGVGLASSIQGRNPLTDGFGLIALASLTPMIFVMAYGTVMLWH